MGARDSAAELDAGDILKNFLCSPVLFGGLLWFVCWMAGSISKRRESGFFSKSIILATVVAVSYTAIYFTSFELTPNTLRELEITNTTSKSDALHQLNLFEKRQEGQDDSKIKFWIESLRDSFENDYYKKVNLYVLYGEGFDILDSDPVSIDTMEALESTLRPEVFVMYLMFGVFAYIHGTFWVIPKKWWCFKVFATTSGLLFMVFLEIVFSESLEEDGEDHLSVFTILKDLFGQPYAIHPQIKLAMRLSFVANYVLMSLATDLFYITVQESFYRSIKSYTKTLTHYRYLGESVKLDRTQGMRELQRGFQEAKQKLRESENRLDELLKEISEEPKPKSATPSIILRQPSIFALVVFWTVNWCHRFLTNTIKYA